VKKHESQGLPLASVLTERVTLIELACAAIILGLGINLAATWIAAHISSSYLLLLAVALIIFGMVLFVIKLLKLRQHMVRLEGVFACRRSDNVVLNIPEYNFGAKLSSIFESAFAENKALEQQWLTGAPGSRLPFLISEDKQAAQLKAAKLLEEATEYYVLEKLSMHLTDFFNRLDKSKDYTIQLQREHVPQVLLQNRFLSLFSMPIDDRPAFLENQSHGMKQPQFKGDLVAAGGNHGAMYQRFDLVLPKNSSRLPRIFSLYTELFL
jgi:hypothetical protein